MPVNGAYYSWEDITVYLPNGPQLDLVSIEYSGEREVELVYGQGGAPRGAGRGNWKGLGALKMHLEQYKSLLEYVQKQNRTIFTIPPFAITVTYGNDDQGLTVDQVLGCRFKRSARKSASGDKSVDVELDFVCTEIQESGVSQTAGLNFA